MSVNNFIPEMWGTLINKELEKQLVYKACTNSNYQGEISGQADRLKINELGPISIGNYTKNSTSIIYQELADASQLLEISQAKYFAMKIDDVDKVQTSPKLLQPAINSAVYAIRDTVDQYLATMHTDAGITANLGDSTTPIEINSSNVAEYIIKIGRLLDDNNVPRDGQRFIVIPPFMLEDLVLADVVKSTDNVQTLANGLVTQYAGFNIRVSNNVVNTASKKYKVIAGHPIACTFASQAGKIESGRLEDSFHDYVRGLYLYGMKVIKPDALACLTANEAAEAV